MDAITFSICAILLCCIVLVYKYIRETLQVGKRIRNAKQRSSSRSPQTIPQTFPIAVDVNPLTSKQKEIIESIESGFHLSSLPGYDYTSADFDGFSDSNIDEIIVLDRKWASTSSGNHLNHKKV